jgi:hypothetical protein
MINRMDICMIQEHWLFNCQIQLLNEIHENLNGIGKYVDDNDPLQPIQMPRGYGGTGILWKKELDHLINVIDEMNVCNAWNLWDHRVNFCLSLFICRV